MTFGIRYAVKIQSRVLSFIIHTRIHYDPPEHVSSTGLEQRKTHVLLPICVADEYLQRFLEDTTVVYLY